MKVIPVAEGTSMECVWISYTVGSSQCGVHIHKHFLSVLHHPIHHLATEILGRVVWQVPIAISGTCNPTATNLEALLYRREQTIAIAFNLKLEQTCSNRISIVFQMRCSKNRPCQVYERTTTYHFQLESTMGF